MEHLRQERCELNEEKRQNEEERSRLEEKIAALDRESEENATDYQKLMAIAAEKEEQEAALLELYERWEELSV